MNVRECFSYFITFMVFLFILYWIGGTEYLEIFFTLVIGMLVVLSIGIMCQACRPPERPYPNKDDEYRTYYLPGEWDGCTYDYSDPD